MAKPCSRDLAVVSHLQNILIRPTGLELAIQSDVAECHVPRLQYHCVLFVARACCAVPRACCHVPRACCHVPCACCHVPRACCHVPCACCPVRVVMYHVR